MSGITFHHPFPSKSKHPLFLENSKSQLFYFLNFFNLFYRKRKMAEASKVRLVRCPKCENLLTELPDFSLYQCGGCGAVLTAKKKGVVDDGLSEKFDDTKGGAVAKEDDVVKFSKVEMDVEDGGVERIQNEVLASNGEVPDDTRRGKERIRNRDDSDDKYKSYPHGLVLNRNRDTNRDLNVDGQEYGNVKGIRPPIDSSRSRPLAEEWGAKSNVPSRDASAAQVRVDDFLYCGEGQSSYGMNSYYERTRYRGLDLDGIDRIESLESGRAELLRKLDELKDQITRSCDMTDKPKEKIGVNLRAVPPTLSDPYGGPHAAYGQEGLTSFDHPSGFVPYPDRYSARVLDPYRQRDYPHEYPHYPNTYKPEILRRHPRGPRPHYMQQPFHERFPGYYSDVNHENFMLHRHENFFHQPACSCVHCCEKNWHMPPRVEPHNRRAQNEPPNPTFHHHANPILHRPQANGSGGSNLHPLQSRHSLSSDLDSENDGFNYHRPRKLVVPQRCGGVCYPIRGGAPFVTCSNCFELLKLPKKHISMEKDLQKMKCGACSSVIMFELMNKGSVDSVPVDVDQLPTEIDEVSGGTVDENVRYWYDGSSTANLNTCSNDYDDFDHKFSPSHKKSNSSLHEKHLDSLSSSSSISEDERASQNILSKKHDSPNPELPLEKDNSVPDPDTSPQELTDHSPENTVVSRFDKWNRSKRPERESISLDRTTSMQNSVRDGAVATDTDVSYNAFSNGNVSQDSAEVSREDPPKANKGGESFFAGLIKKSFRDFKKSNQGAEVGGSQVFVNGHLIPDRLVKKAEKLAGPIQPGEYWYDKQAGFWGVLGHPCLGIVMPNIEEFNYPLPKHCAAGNTGVFVNGRELHQKDLDLLASRGLPITRNRSYIVEITGKVVDEQTGKELDGLGKLAPTVERAKHGFGMKVPRSVAQSKS